MPPEPIADVLGAVLMLLGIRDTSWLSMKKFLGNRGVKDEILNFDARRIDPQLRAQVGGCVHDDASTSLVSSTMTVISGLGIMALLNVREAHSNQHRHLGLVS